MNNSNNIHDEQADTIRIEDITTDINNGIVLRRLRNNEQGEYGDENEYLWIQNQHDEADGFDTCTDYVPGGAYDMGWLGYFVGKSDVLRNLRINNIDPVSVESSLIPFLRGLNHNRSISDIRFNNHNFRILGGEMFTMIDSFFKNNHNLIDMTVNSCNLGEDECRLFGLAIGCCSKSLECLRMRNNDLTEEGSVAVIASLSMHPQLKLLELQGGVIHPRNNIRKKGFMTLATLLYHSPTELQLQTLDLSNNDIDDEGMDALAPALTKLSHLESLNLGNNRSVTMRGWQSLATVLEDPNSNLQILTVSENNIDDQTASVFIKTLSRNCTLQKLYLGAVEYGRENQLNYGVSKGRLKSFSNLLCDTSSVNATYLSNHTLMRLNNIMHYDSKLKELLTSNRKDDKTEVATIKILKHHDDFDMKPFFEWEFKVLPLVISWLERASSYTTDFDANIEGRKLSSIYQFIKNMPVLYVETRLRQELADILSKVPQMEEEERERRLQFQQLQRQLQDRKKTIMEKLGVGKQA